MMAIGFLGYICSPKWFDRTTIYLLFQVYALLIYSAYIKVKFNTCMSNEKLYITICERNGKSFNNALSNRRNFSTSTQSSVQEPSVNTSGRLQEIIKELNINPVYAFENLSSEEVRKQILHKTRGLSGIYMIMNKTTSDFYIGSASTNRFYSRFSRHLIYFLGSKIVKHAVKKYKLENFAFLILELFPEIVNQINNKKLMELEDKYLKLLLPDYNILTEAGSSFGYKHTETVRQKMKDIYSDERRKKIGDLNRGKKLSQETIELMREKALERLPMSDEVKKKCVVNTRSVILYNLNNTVYGTFATVKDAANAINCNEKTIHRSLQTPKKIVKRN